MGNGHGLRFESVDGGRGWFLFSNFWFGKLSKGPKFRSCVAEKGFIRNIDKRGGSRTEEIIFNLSIETSCTWYILARPELQLDYIAVELYIIYFPGRVRPLSAGDGSNLNGSRVNIVFYLIYLLSFYTSSNSLSYVILYLCFPSSFVAGLEAPFI